MSVFGFSRNLSNSEPEPEAHKQRDAWAVQHAVKSAGKGAPPSKIERMRQKLYNAVTIGDVLPPDLILYHQDGGEVSVAEVYANPSKWDGKRFAYS